MDIGHEISHQTSYWKCTLFRSGCRARITTEDRRLTFPVPEHTRCTTRGDSSAPVHKAKQTLKKKAVETDLPTKHIVAESVCGRSPLGSVSKAERNRQAANRHPANSRSLEDLILPPQFIRANSGEPMLLWDSGYTITRRRSFWFGTPPEHIYWKVGMDADHFIIDGMFKSAPKMFMQMLTVHGLLSDGWHLPLASWPTVSFQEKQRPSTLLYEKSLTHLGLLNHKLSKCSLRLRTSLTQCCSSCLAFYL